MLFRSHRLSLMTQISEAYNNSFCIPIDKLSFTFGIPLTLHLEQTTNIMAAWLLQLQASQKYLANILKPERCNQEGKITNFFISRNHGHYTETPPGYINSTNLPHLHFNLSPMAQVQPNKLSRLALLWCTLKFNTLFVIRILETHTST